MARAFATIAFTPTVRNLQQQYGSNIAYDKFLENDQPEANFLGAQEVDFITQRDGFYQASQSEEDWPYVQFRGGPKGFLKVIDKKTIAYADFRGNRQYISTGNLTKNNRISLILMDYPNRRRLKIWGEVSLVSAEDNPEIISQLHDETYRAKPERAVIITIKAYDWNCPQHIPVRLTREEWQPEWENFQEQMTALEAENQALRQKLEQL